ncbi:H-NS histone family protein [Pseudooctadecabacter sp.]|uniref:H-NS histone family protein n=1 Tax=Pseudooctadecabacter sp. TaxID=1966338 RepID=UPI0025D480CF|nr:H-NS histone family protein [Pseudooctadecabacter sp.]
MAIDLKAMSKKDLEKLAKDVEKALARIQKQEVKKLRQEMEKLAAAHGMTVEDVMAAKGTSAAPKLKSSKPKSAPKYANPADKTQTWTGKGRKPDWFKAAVDAGATPDSMAV